MPDWGSMVGEIAAPLPSWDRVKQGASSAWDTVSSGASDIWNQVTSPSIAPMVGEMALPLGVPDLPFGLPDIGPMVGEMQLPLGVPDLPFGLPDLPDIGPMAGEMLVGPGGLPGDFLPGGGGGGLPFIGEGLPSLPDIPWDMAGELGLF